MWNLQNPKLETKGGNPDKAYPKRFHWNWNPKLGKEKTFCLKSGFVRPN